MIKNLSGVRSVVVITSEITPEGGEGFAWRCKGCGNTAGHPIKNIPAERTKPFTDQARAFEAASKHANEVCSR